MRFVLPWDCVMHDNHKHIPVVQGKHARLILSPEYRAKKIMAEASLMQQRKGQEAMSGEIRLTAYCVFPDRRKRDSGNYRKLITDALTGIAYTDDSQLVSETWEKAAIDRENPRIEINLEAA